MALAPGDRVGPYEIVSALGAGGMGEVYRARDGRLAREVALKLLPPSFAADPDRLSRFSREALLLASLNHPNIAQLYGLEERAGSGPPVLVMELIDGPTLADRLAAGPLPPDEALPAARQIASALEYAHDSGIVHRDLKPANIKLRQDGTVKVLDFGLAKALDRGQDTDPASARSNSPTVPADTASGVVLGTASYMAPEQVRGRPVDKRADIWAFGVVLFEMLAGGRAFGGDSASDIMAAVIRDDPPWGNLPPRTPPHVIALLQRCLVRDPRQRLRDIGEARVLLERGEDSGAPAIPPPVARAASARRSPVLWALAGAALAAVAVALGMTWRTRPRPAAPLPLRFTLAQTADVALSQQNTVGPTLAISPDGRHIVRSAPEGLVLWDAASGSTRLIDDTAGASAPFFSPDGEQIAFFSRGDLRRVAVAGGPSSVIAGSAGGQSGSWAHDGTILFSRWIGTDIGIWRVSAQTGEQRLLAPAANLAAVRMFPSFLPDSNHYLFLKNAGPVGERQICIASLDDDPERCIAQGDSNVAYSATGHLIFVRAGALVALPFDAGTRTATGGATTLVSRVRWFGPVGAAAFAASADGRVLAHAPPPPARRLLWMDRSGKTLGELGTPGQYNQVQLSPDGTRLAVDQWNTSNGGRDLWVMDVASGDATRVTFEPLDTYLGAWSSNRALLYSKPTTSPPDVFELVLGGGTPTPLVERPGVQLAQHASADGKWLAFLDVVLDGNVRHVWLSPRGGPPRRLRDTPANTFDPRFSPDGRSIAFVSDESGSAEVYVRPLAEGSEPRRVSRGGGFLPRWRGDGRELFFFRPDGALMTVDPASPSQPDVLFRVEGVSEADIHSPPRERYATFDVTADGQRFLFRVAAGAGTRADELHVWIDWAHAPR